MPPAARMGDFHACPMVTPGTPPIPHVGGPILPTCSINVFTGMIPQARVTDKALCVGPPDVIVKGSAGVFVNYLPAARIGDTTAHGGSIVVGLPTVMIGEVGGGGAGPGGVSVVIAQLGLENPGGDQAQMADTMIAAGQQGAPFCEQCMRNG